MKEKEIMDSRLMALEVRIEESIALFREILGHEPCNMYASLLLGSIQYHDNNQPAEAIRICDSLLARGFEDQPNPKRLQALTLFTKGVAFGYMGLHNQAIQVFNKIIGRFCESNDSSLNGRDRINRLFLQMFGRNVLTQRVVHFHGKVFDSSNHL